MELNTLCERCKEDCKQFKQVEIIHCDFNPKKRTSQFCDGCGKNRENASQIKSYNGEMLTVCPTCKDDMELTLKCMELSAIDAMSKGGFVRTESPVILKEA